MTMIEKVAQAIDEVQCFIRINDDDANSFRSKPVEICRRAKHGEFSRDGVIVLRRFSSEVDEINALQMVISELRARAAIEALRNPSPYVLEEWQDRSFSTRNIAERWDDCINAIQDEKTRP